VDEEEPARVGHSDDAGVAEIEAADLVGRAVAVLHSAHHPEPCMPVAVEVDDDIDEVL